MCVRVCGQALSGDVDRFCREVEESVGSQHYEAAHLGLLGRSLLEKNSRANRTVTERLRVARGGVGFYKGVDKVSVYIILYNIYKYTFFPAACLHHGQVP